MEHMPSIENEKAISDESFETQFDDVEQYRVAGGVLKAVDITPEKLKEQTPVVVIPGWAQTFEVYKPAIKTLAEQERRVISFTHPRAGGDMDKIAPQELLDEHPKEELRRALNIIGMLDQKGIEKVDLIAHSEGGVDAVITAIIAPEKIRNIVLFAPAGLIGKDSFRRLAGGLWEQIRTGRVESMKDVPPNETEKWVADISMKATLGAIAANPVRTSKEAYELASTQTHEMLRKLHDLGIGIVVMAAIDDKIFPMDKMQNTVKADMLDGFLSLMGNHGAIGEHPELFMTGAEKMLTAVQEKKERKTLAN